MLRVLSIFFTALALPASAAFAQVHWQPANGGGVPGNAIIAGQEADGTPLAACTAFHAGGFHPGKVRPALGGCNIGYGGAEITVGTYEVLVE